MMELTRAPRRTPVTPRQAPAASPGADRNPCVARSVYVCMTLLSGNARRFGTTGRSTGLQVSLLTAVLLLAACTTGQATRSGSPAERSAASASAAPVVDLDGVRVMDRGVTQWEDGVVLDDPHVLRVMAVGLDGPPTPCADAVAVRAIRQSGSEVVLEARRYELADKPKQYDCALPGMAPQPREIRLDEPLGGRRVIDASTATARPVIAFDDVPTVQQVPAGYQWRPPTWDDARRVVTRSWGSRDGRLTLEIGPGSQLQSLPAVLKQGRINGQPATVSRVIMLSCARWGPPDLTLNLCSRDAGAGDPPLGPQELLDVGATVG